MACVPTIYAELLRYADEHKPNLRSLQTAICGGATMPISLAQAFEERHGVPLLHAWGMTETSPMCTVARAPADLGEDGAVASPRDAGAAGAVRRPARSWGKSGEEVAWDGAATGEIEVRGPWIARAYFQRGGSGEIRRRLAAHRRHRARRPGRLGDDHGPLEGRDQVRRRVDLVSRAREPADGTPGGARGGRHRDARRALERAAARVRRARGRLARSARPTCVEHLRGKVAELVASRGVRVRRQKCPRRASASSTRRCCGRALAEGRLEGRVRVK